MKKYIIDEDFTNAEISNIPFEMDYFSSIEILIKENIQFFSLSFDYLLKNWYFTDFLTTKFFFHGKNKNYFNKPEQSMEILALECEIFLEFFYIINGEVYYPYYNKEIKNWEFLNFSSIPYPKVIAAGIYHYLNNEKKKNGDLLYKKIFFAKIIDYLVDPLFHNEVLNILKKDIFISIKFAFGSAFLNIIKLTNENNTAKEPYYKDRVVRSMREINSKFFSNILTYIGVPEEKIVVLLENWNVTHDLNEIQLYLEDFLK